MSLYDGARVDVYVSVCAYVPPHFQTYWPISSKFYLKHHWGEGDAALGLGSDQISSFYGFIMEKTLLSWFIDCFVSDHVCR